MLTGHKQSQRDREVQDGASACRVEIRLLNARSQTRNCYFGLWGLCLLLLILRSVVKFMFALAAGGLSMNLHFCSQREAEACWDFPTEEKTGTKSNQCPTQRNAENTSAGKLVKRGRVSLRALARGVLAHHPEAHTVISFRMTGN